MSELFYAPIPSKYYTKHWGRADEEQELAPGIVRYWTPSHGGYELSDERMAEMPAHLRACSFTGDNCFEEDASWCAVALNWPLLFRDDDVDAARKTYEQFYAKREAV